jgi:hypothetical protein
MLPYYTPTAPGGHVISRDENRRVVEDRMARIIEEDGFPSGHSSYVLRCHWDGDGRWCARGTLLDRLILGCDEDGWYDLDGSKVPRTAAPARRIGA